MTDSTRGRDFTSSTKDVKGKEVLEELYKRPEILLDYQVIAELKKKFSDAKIVETLYDYYKKKLEMIKSKSQKFKAALMTRYGTVGLSTTQLLEKAKKFKKRYNLTDGEFSMFVNLVFSDRTYPYPNMYNVPSTPMSKALGYSIDAIAGDKLNISEGEMSDLKSILQMDIENKQIHEQITMQSLMYKDCDPTALLGTFDHNKHLAYNYVHPVIAALFLPKIPYLEQHMIIASISNIVKQKSENRPILTLHEYELYWDLITDPNHTACVKDDNKPITDLKNRVILQNKLWESVMYLRQGKYYLDDIGKFIAAVRNCQNSIFDAPDFTYVIDEGTILRRLLNAFSLRPTVVSIAPLFSSPTTAYPTYSAPLSYTQVTTVPMINMRLPMNVGSTGTSVALKEALAQPQWFIEGKTLVPKTQTIVYSRDVLFFYANRRFKGINFARLNQPYVFNALPATLSGIESINKTLITFDDDINVGEDNFGLRSVVVVESAYTDEGKEFISGCNACIAVAPSPLTRYSDEYLLYDPQLAGHMFQNIGKPGYDRIPPITTIDKMVNPYIASQPNSTESFQDRAQQRGTIFVYVKTN